MSDAVDFVFDVVCPYAYLASVRIEAMAQRRGATVRWRPILLGGLLRTVGAPDDPNEVMSAPKRAQLRADRARWASLLGVPLREPEGHPRRTVDAMRLCIAAPDGPVRASVARALFDAYWVSGRDPSDPSLLAEIARDHGLPPDAHAEPRHRDALREATAWAAEAGAFGVPTMLVGDRLWWGQDRLALVEEALGGRPPPLRSTGEGPGAETRLTVFHDFASPFSYLAFTQLERIAAARGATLELAPILLGALFREIGTPDVPLHQMNPTKQAYVRRDLEDWAGWWGVPFRFPSHFPLRSVLPLRVVLAEPAATSSIYRAVWAEDRRVDEPEALGPVLDAAGLPAAELLTSATTPEVKARLRANTERARELGVCGVPTVLAERSGRSALVWGQDRLSHVEAILDGWWPPDEPS